MGPCGKGCLLFAQMCIFYLPGAGHSECLGTENTLADKEWFCLVGLTIVFSIGDSKCAECQIDVP